MPIDLKPVDVVVIGLGAAGGVAVLPLARAGLKVAGLEAGTWMTKEPGKFFHADEIYNNVRGLVTTGNKVHGEIPTVRNGLTGPTTRGNTHPMMNAIGGTSIHYHAQSWRFTSVGFQSALVFDPALWRKFHPPGIDHRRLAHRLRRSGALLRHRRTGNRRLRPRGKYSGQADRPGQQFRRTPPARISHASAARHRFHQT